jgi:lipopolysaccharide/colanic/teichoic acid biosynthesis glycosyltransferase
MKLMSLKSRLPASSELEPPARAPIEVRLYSGLQEAFAADPPVSSRGCERALGGWPGTLKRAEDLAIGALLLVLVAPVLLVIAVLIKLDSKGPVLFRQPRVGRGNRIFEILKFRTMYVEYADFGAERQTCRGDRRVTRIGAVLRRSSLDELPQLLNVLGGSMSIVGPRPHALCTTVGGTLLEKAVPAYPLRHRVKPGITGLAQVNGCRGELNSVEKLSRRVDLDLEYIENWSLGLDLRILGKTARVVLGDPNAY